MQGKLRASNSLTGHLSIAPEGLIRSFLLQILYPIRCERQLVEQLQYNLLYRYFVGPTIDDAVCDASTFTKNWPSIIDHKVTARPGRSG